MTMNLKLLYEILDDTTVPLRKGEVVHESERDGLHVITIDAMPHVDEASPKLEKVDLMFLVVGVNKERAEKRRSELISILNNYPEPQRIAGGPSYIEVGAEIGDQGAAFRLFALGKVLGLWDIITPATLGLTGEMAMAAAGTGYIMISGYHAQELDDEGDSMLRTKPQ